MSKPWYEAAFGADYLERYAYRDAGEARQTVRRLLADAPCSSGLALDLCCGAGRHALALREEGYRVVGLDLSADLLEAAVRSFRELTECFCSEEQPGDCPLFVRGDKRRLPFARERFRLVTHFFTAFGYFESDQENLDVFREVARILEPGGGYLFDFLSAPAVLRELNAAQEAVWAVEEFADGSRVDTMKSLTPDGRRVEKEVRILHGGKLKNLFLESVRLFQPEELRAGLARAGFSIRNEWGGYSAEPYDERTSSRWIVLCRKQQATSPGKEPE